MKRQVWIKLRNACGSVNLQLQAGDRWDPGVRGTHGRSCRVHPDLLTILSPTLAQTFGALGNSNAGHGRGDEADDVKAGT